MIACTLYGGPLDGTVKHIASPYLPTMLWFVPLHSDWVVVGTDRTPPGVAFPAALVYAIDADDEVSMRRGAVQGAATYTLRGQP